MKQLNKFNDLKQEKLDFEVKENEQDYYHVFLVKKINDTANERYITTVERQVYGKRSFSKIKTQFKFLGYNELIVLHDPTAPKVESGDDAFNVSRANGDSLKAYAEANNIDISEATNVKETRAIVKDFIDNKSK